MGTFTVKVTVLNPLDPSRSATVKCLVDTGGACSQLPSDLLESLGITLFDQRPAIFADGRRGPCRVGRADFVHDGRQPPALVVFGEHDALAPLGAMTLDDLGLGVDPIGKRWLPMDVPMASFLLIISSRPTLEMPHGAGTIPYFPPLRVAKPGTAALTHRGQDG